MKLLHEFELLSGHGQYSAKQLLLLHKFKFQDSRSMLYYSRQARRGGNQN